MEATCTNCTEHFPSKTKLHKHLRTGCRANKVNTGSVNSLPVNLAEAQVIESTASQEGVGSGSAYRAWNFAEAQVMFLPEATGAATIYIDTGYGITLCDKQWLAKVLPEAPIQTIEVPLKVRGVGTSLQETSEYTVVPFYLPGPRRYG